jgi:8-oxo-dGTP diphosphatase
MTDIIRTAGVLIYRDQEVLLVRHGTAAGHLTGVYGLPSGSLKEGETELEAAVRELEEETGLTTSQKDLVELPETYTAEIQRKDGVKKFSFKVFLCKRFSGELKETEETTPEWVKISDLKKYKLLPNVEEIVKGGLRYR